MIEVPVNVCGDHWCNSDDMHEYLAKFTPGQKILIRVNTEGPSLYALGVVPVIESFCQRNSIPLQDVEITGWCNEVETVPFTRITRFLYSHFYFMSERYWRSDLEPTHQGQLFGLFIGRATVPRQIIMWQMWNSLRDHCLFSVMRHNAANTERGINLDRADDWRHVADPDQVQTWWDQNPIPSLDKKCVRDQYVPDRNTNLDLLAFYDQFQIEIACETYTHGTCFFPTEKTVRPIVGLKPFFVYGPRNFLHHLREQGFETWSDFWCEDYDCYEGAERWLRMKQEIDRLSELSHNDRVSMMQSMEPLLRSNKQNLATIKKLYGPI
jgi:hypothetical protein